MIRLSQEAEKKAKELFDHPSNKGYIGFRIKARMNGCNVNYEMTLEDIKRPGDAVVEQGFMNIFMDIDSFHMLTGAVIEYVKQGDSEGFMILQKSSPCSACKVSSLGNCS
ncbi:hypothetical protein BKP45_00230 [Anaerobacillus alkalidiazotrophicus]|uniref:Uncharacterized protein n=1 Tax=Anaerobacillus alkalidiazotrophicus TaxID=472963 RepID=A0A1S2MBL3_9BACI|nr:iron-sulfur cluster biosynthesis family protein [Anaerobacillus alkalidiazotrophicus]OIJ21247.1 hypothetical protein BKP45_00230 [Anaerobacillus alkalidiazotrophicus]